MLISQAASPHPNQVVKRGMGGSQSSTYAPVAPGYAQQPQQSYAPAGAGYNPAYQSPPQVSARAVGGSQAGGQPAQASPIAQDASAAPKANGGIRVSEIDAVAQNESVKTAVMRRMGQEWYNQTPSVLTSEMDAGLPIDELSEIYYYKKKTDASVELTQEFSFRGDKLLDGSPRDRELFVIAADGEEIISTLSDAVNRNCNGGINPGVGFELCSPNLWRIAEVWLAGVDSSHPVNLICTSQPFLNRGKVVGAGMCMKSIAAGKSDLLTIGRFDEVNGVEAVESIGCINSMAEIEASCKSWPYGVGVNWYGSVLGGTDSEPFAVSGNSLVANGLYCTLEPQTIAYINEYKKRNNHTFFLVTKKHKNAALEWVKTVALATSPFHRLDEGFSFIVSPLPCGCDSTHFKEVDASWRTADNLLETDFTCPRQLGKYAPSDGGYANHPTHFNRQVKPTVVSLSFTLRIKFKVLRTRLADPDKYWRAHYHKHPLLLTSQ